MKYKYVSWLPAILIMLMIFYFSSKPATISGENSLRIANYVMKLYENITDSVVDEHRIEKLDTLEHYIRKTAHVIEYAILAAAICLPLRLRGLKRRRLLLWSVLATAIYAASDEIHQRFVPGRSGRLQDVLIDTLGAILGAIFFLLATGTLRHIGRDTKESIPDSEESS